VDPLADLIAADPSISLRMYLSPATNDRPRPPQGLHPEYNVETIAVFVGVDAVKANDVHASTIAQLFSGVKTFTKSLRLSSEKCSIIGV